MLYCSLSNLYKVRSVMEEAMAKPNYVRKR